jgi:hypothetical protein
MAVKKAKTGTLPPNIRAEITKTLQAFAEQEKKTLKGKPQVIETQTALWYVAYKTQA